MVRLVDPRRTNRALDRSPPRDAAASWNRRNSQLRGSLFTTEQGFPKLIRAGGQLERDIRRLRSAARSVKKAGQPRFDQRDPFAGRSCPSSHAHRKLLKQLLLRQLLPDQSGPPTLINGCRSRCMVYRGQSRSRFRGEPAGFHPSPPRIGTAFP